MPGSPQKMCGSFEGFSTFSRDFKGNKNVTLANISKNKKVMVRFFITLYLNKLKSKLTEKFCGLLQLKLKVGHKKYQM